MQQFVSTISPLQGNSKGYLVEAKIEQSGILPMKKVGRIRKVGKTPISNFGQVGNPLSV